MEEEEAQSQLGEVPCHAEQPRQLLSLLQILLRARKKEILKSWIQMQQGYCGKAWGYGLWSLVQHWAPVLLLYLDLVESR